MTPSREATVTLRESGAMPREDTHHATMPCTIPLAHVAEALGDLGAGRPVVVVDQEDTEAVGALVARGDLVGADIVGFMMREARGMITVPMTEERIGELHLRLIEEGADRRAGAPLVVPIDARAARVGGTDASTCAASIQALADPATSAFDLVRPGHTFPVKAHAAGVLGHHGHAEAAVDLARLAGSQPVAAMCWILDDQGMVRHGPSLHDFAELHGLRIISIGQVVGYRRFRECTVIPAVDAVEMPTRFGEFQAIGYSDVVTGDEHVALIGGDMSTDSPTVVAVHRECSLGDIFASRICQCHEELVAALRWIGQSGGILIYLRPSQNHAPTRHVDPPAEECSWTDLEHASAVGVGLEILCGLGVRQVRFLTDHPEVIRRAFDHSTAVDRGLELLETIDILKENTGDHVAAARAIPTSA